MSRQSRSKCEPATKAELAWIEKFKSICEKAPKSLWLFSASGTLCIMKTPADGNQNGCDTRGEGVNPDNCLDIAKIRNDGGDW